MPHMSQARLPQGRMLLPTFLAILASGLMAFSAAKAEESEKSWNDLRETLFGSRSIEDGTAMLSLAAPDRADDPAIVPVQIGDIRPAGASVIKTLTLIVDENPAPVAAVFSLAPEAHISALETRIRVNAYSFLRVIAETEDGALHMVKRYIKATGGCSAPASKNADEAMASLGQMRLRQYPAAGGAADEREMQLQIRHPNYSGLQMDQITGLYRPAHYVTTISIMADAKPVMSIEGAISLSENPSVRFKFRPNGARTLSARAEDTEGKVFEKSWTVGEDASDAPPSR